MNKTTTFFAAGRWLAIAAALVIAIGLLAGCGAEPTAVVSQATAAPTEAPTQAPTEAPTERPTPTLVPTEPPTSPPPTDTTAPTDTPAPTETATPEAVDDSACITCHTSEETLQALATEEEAPAAESEGEG